MGITEFLVYSIKEGLVLTLEWYKACFTVPKSKSVVYVEDNYFYHDGIRLVKFTGKPLMKVDDIVELPKGVMSIKPNGVKNTIGSILQNYLLFEYALNGKFPYINGQFDDGKFSSKVDRQIGKKVTIDEYRKLGTVATMFRNMAKYMVIPSTEDSFFPPEDLQTVKAKTVKEFEAKYGENWYSDKLLIVRFEDQMMAWVKDKFKDDPTMNITMDKKALKAFKKKYVSMGIAETLEKTEETKAIMTSLHEEYPMDRETMTKVINSVIYGSAMRGLSTIDAGVIVKRLMAAVHAMKITKDDCNTIDAYPILVTENRVEALAAFYFVKNGKTVKLSEEEIRASIGKKLNVRTIIYCKLKGLNVCKTCAGDYLSISENGPVLVASYVTGDNLNFQLSKFHGVSYEEYAFNKKQFLGL